MLACLEGEEVISPFDQEEAVGEACFLVGNGVKHLPVYLGKLFERPVVEAAEVLTLGLVVNVRQCGSANVSELGREAPGDGPLVKFQHHRGGREKRDTDGRCVLTTKVSGSELIATRVNSGLPGDNAICTVKMLLVAVDVLVHRP